MRTKVFSLGLSKKLLVAGMITMLLSVSLLSTLTEHVFAAPDKFGIEQLYPNADGGCGAYGYYGMLSSDGDAFFKKKLFHHGGYSDSTAQRQGVVDNLQDRWIGIKLVVYNLDSGDVKLELWVDDGDETNNWRKATEYVDDGGWEVAGSDCGRDGDETIDEGTRGAFRVDDSVFEFKKLSIREIVGSGEVAEGALLEEGGAATEEEVEEGEAATAEQEEEGGAATAEEEEEGGAATAEEEEEGGAATAEEEEEGGAATAEEEEEATVDQ